MLPPELVTWGTPQGKNSVGAMEDLSTPIRLCSGIALEA